jgi:hypothetical protein
VESDDAGAPHQPSSLNAIQSPQRRLPARAFDCSPTEVREPLWPWHQRLGDQEEAASEPRGRSGQLAKAGPPVAITVPRARSANAE